MNFDYGLANEFNAFSMSHSLQSQAHDDLLEKCPLDVSIKLAAVSRFRLFQACLAHVKLMENLLQFRVEQRQVPC